MTSTVNLTFQTGNNGVAVIYGISEYEKLGYSPDGVLSFLGSVKEGPDVLPSLGWDVRDFLPDTTGYIPAKLILLRGKAWKHGCYVAYQDLGFIRDLQGNLLGNV